MAHSQFKVIHVMEGGCGTVLLGASGIPVAKMEETLNKEAADGWQVVFMVVDQSRLASASLGGGAFTALEPGGAICVSL